MLYTKYISCGPEDFREEDFFSFFLYKSMGAYDPWGEASLDPRGSIGRIYVWDHYTLLHTKYISSRPHGFREEDFLSFSHYKSMGANDPRGLASLDPRGVIGSIYVGDHQTLLHTNYISSEPHGFREEDFLIFSHYKLMGATDPRGVASLGPRGLIGRIYVGDH